jgi:hypothetical protein
MKQATHFSDKVKLWFMPPGWRPRNLPPYEKKNPHTTARDQVKFRTPALSGSTPYLSAQLVLSMATLLLVIRDASPFTALERVILSLLLWFGVTLWGAILESKPWARIVELVRIALNFLVLNIFFNLHQFPAPWTAALASISVVSALWVWFGMNEKGMEASLA